MADVLYNVTGVSAFILTTKQGLRRAVIAKALGGSGMHREGMG
jgi:hypothetical protein